MTGQNSWAEKNFYCGEGGNDFEEEIFIHAPCRSDGFFAGRLRR